MTNSVYHEPVLFEESIHALNIPKSGVVVDVTFGGGGHSREILRKLGKNGTLVSFDQDDDAINNRIDDVRFVLVNANFRFLINFMKFYDLMDADAILADLGVSSHQFDTGDRGFSIRENAKLDMRMNKNASLTAHKIINHYPEQELFRIFNAYADLQNTKKVVYTLINARKKNSIETTGDLVNLLSELVPQPKRNQFLAQVFQALRMEVNDELGALKDMLEQSAKVLKKGGRLVVISYHSIEDRLVKNFIRTGNFEGEADKDMYGNIRKPFQAVNSKPIVPGDEELLRNPRSRSAKMRIAERI